MTEAIQSPTPKNAIGEIPANGTRRAMGMATQQGTRLSQNDGTRPTVNDGTQRRRYKPRARHCKTCGIEFTPDAKHGRYCSTNCRKKAYRQRLAKGRKPAPAPVEQLDLITCAHCGGTNLLPAGKGAKYCSATCRQRAYKARRLATVEALMRLGNYDLATASDKLDVAGLQKITKMFQALGWSYHEPSRRWQMPGQELAAAGN